MIVRPYDRESDADALWDLKRAFETGLGTGTGGEEKAEKYTAKLTDDYREGYLEWVDRCVDRDERSVQVAVDDSDDHGSGDLVGYVFLLPDSHAYIWDAAVLNEIYVRERVRGTGVADDLMDAAVAAARDQNLPLERLVLDVDRENDRAQAFYDRHGFEGWGEMVARDL
ncbi:N-acetyltransferase [Halobiforma lacisalsi AJ5]|uniref:N-acetyltransferase n=1 Tax=Natronobacterium lacisalsi AJ5 TaxID=358396 RepID=M0LZD2_NATLA|nr:GNAT family N-acetyltransferase [Halobiforma lacisalsi]APW97778.1 N-acetyltransferase [Halobiforma lacisalsi AJ5]EMA37475.1 GCN5-related N-acetyltransferase [Halobiforma lacisalsi AJ5]